MLYFCAEMWKCGRTQQLQDYKYKQKAQLSAQNYAIYIMYAKKGDFNTNA